jgi:hypothetical protein
MRSRILLPIASAAFAAAAVVLVFATGASQAEAAAYHFTATLDEAQAASTCAGGGPTGSGTGTIAYNDVTNELSWSVTFSGLSGPATLAHFHGPAGPGVDAGIQVDMSSDLTSPIQGSTILSDATDPPKTKAQLESQLLSGLWYINIHTGACGGGEIRGQVLAAGGVGGVAELPNIEDAGAALAQPSGADGTDWSLIAVASGAAAVLVLLGAAFVFAPRRAR